MNIIVCIKQVIAGDQVRIDPRTHSLVRSAEFSHINPFDLFALDMAVRLKKEYSGSITAVTMGPKISEEVLWEALAIGADRAVLLSDPRFAASDTLATSYVLGMGIRKIGNFDLILCGMRTTDSDTGQVGPQLAEELDLPSCHRRGEAGEEEGSVSRRTSLRRIQRDPGGPRTRFVYHLFEDGGAPSEFDWRSRMPSPRSSIECWNLEDLKADPTKVGSAGSCTWVEELIPIAQQKILRLYRGRPPAAGQVAFFKIDREESL